MNREKDYKDEKNLAVVIAEQNLDAFQPRRISDPAAFFMNKRIRVTRTIGFGDEQCQIHVSDPIRVTIVDPDR